MGMGMRVGGSSGAWAGQSVAAVGGWQQRQQGVKDLMATLKAGDLAGAQKAFAALQSSSGNMLKDSSLGKIGEALKSNDLAAAEKISQSMQAARTAQTTQAASHPPSASPLSMLRGLGADVDVMA